MNGLATRQPVEVRGGRPSSRGRPARHGKAVQARRSGSVGMPLIGGVLDRLVGESCVCVIFT